MISLLAVVDVSNEKQWARKAGHRDFYEVIGAAATTKYLFYTPYMIVLKACTGLCFVTVLSTNTEGL